MAAAGAGAGGEGKKRGASRSWILFDAAGEERVLDADKYAIMHRVDINARDLRILDPLLSYPSTILGRERAIVLNLEVRPLVPPASPILRCLCAANDAVFFCSVDVVGGIMERRMLGPGRSPELLEFPFLLRHVTWCFVARRCCQLWSGRAKFLVGSA